MDSSNTMADWKQIAEYHRKQMEIAEQKIKDNILTSSEFDKMVIAIETRSAYKPMWRRAIKDGLIQNVSNILDDCYEYLLSSDMDAEFLAKGKEVMGTIGSRKWQLFTLEVIKYLYKEGSFNDEDHSINTFEDTAGGCDEITQDAAIAVIENSSYSLPDNPIITISVPAGKIMIDPIDKDSPDWNRNLNSGSVVNV
jgi:hypothetical protein